MDELKIELGKLKEDYSKIVEENHKLKTALRKRAGNEGRMPSRQEKKLSAYIDSRSKSSLDKINSIEVNIKNKLNNILRVVNSELDDEYDNTFMEIAEIELNVQNQLKSQRAKVQLEKERLINEVQDEYIKVEDTLKGSVGSPVNLTKPREKLEKRIALESKIGLNVINIIGAVLILLGVATLAKYTYSNWLNDYTKSISGILLGIVFLVIGELLNRKGKNVFSIGMCGTGIGTLYISLFNSYFILNTINLTTALILSLLVTAISIIISRNYKSKAIMFISLFGGYLPFFSYVWFEGLNAGLCHLAMVYFIILNTVVLIISLNNRWISVYYFSFMMNIPTSLYLATGANNKLISLAYLTMVFIIYLLIILVKPITENLKFKTSEILLLAINTFVNCCSIYWIFSLLGWNDYYGFLALAFAVLYIGLSYMIKGRAESEALEASEAGQVVGAGQAGQAVGALESGVLTERNKISNLFIITSLTFVVLMIPFQFGVKWASMGWLVESVLLLQLARMSYKDDKVINTSGWVIFSLCFISFMLSDFWHTGDKYFVFKYTSMAVSLIYVLIIHLPLFTEELNFRYTLKGKVVQFLKYITIVFTWIYLVRVSSHYYDTAAYKVGKDDIRIFWYFWPVFYSLITALYALVCSKIDKIKDKAVDAMIVIMNLIATITCLKVTSNSVLYYSENKSVRIIAITILILYNILMFNSVQDLIYRAINRLKLTVGTYTLMIAIYLLGIISIFTVNQFNMGNVELLLNMIQMILALSYITYGFKFKNIAVRRLGLGLSIFVIVKLFLFDLSYLDIAGRIISYLTFGVILTLISFIYQRVESKTDK